MYYDARSAEHFTVLMYYDARSAEHFTILMYYDARSAEHFTILMYYDARSANVKLLSSPALFFMHLQSITTKRLKEDIAGIQISKNQQLLIYVFADFPVRISET
jgi:hypothetical protein